MRTNKCKANKDIDQNFLATRISDQTDISHNFNYFVLGGGGLFILNTRNIKDNSAGRDIAVGIATRYGLDGPGIEFR